MAYVSSLPTYPPEEAKADPIALQGLSLGLSGFGFHATDIGGFKTPGDRPIPPDPTLYKRWIQWGLLASHSRLHGSTQYRVPWEVEPDSEESSDVLRKFVKLKHRLMPCVVFAPFAPCSRALTGGIVIS